jgi:hypothetical protein
MVLEPVAAAGTVISRVLSGTGGTTAAIIVTSSRLSAR